MFAPVYAWGSGRFSILNHSSFFQRLFFGHTFLATWNKYPPHCDFLPSHRMQWQSGWEDSENPIKDCLLSEYYKWLIGWNTSFCPWDIYQVRSAVRVCDGNWFNLISCSSSGGLHLAQTCWPLGIQRFFKALFWPIVWAKMSVALKGCSKTLGPSNRGEIFIFLLARQMISELMKVNQFKPWSRCLENVAAGFDES